MLKDELKNDNLRNSSGSLRKGDRWIEIFKLSHSFFFGDCYLRKIYFNVT